MMKERTDQHRPSQIDPTDYDYVGMFVLNPPCTEDGEIVVDMPTIFGDVEFLADGRTYADLFAVSEADAQIGLADAPDDPNTTRPYRTHLDRCDHCGARLNYVAVFTYLPTDEFVIVGSDCADNTLGMDSRRAVDAKRLRDLMASARANVAQEKERVKNLEEFRASYPAAFAILDRYDGGNSFIADVAGRLASYGRAARGDQDKVAKAIVAAHDRDLARTEEQKDAEDAFTGRGTVEGEVISLKWKESHFGDTLKMTVRDDRGFAVWGTVPTSLADAHVERGDRVQFVATVEPSDRDSKFGFFKRPAKAKVTVRGE